MSQEEFVERNGIRITAEDLRSHYRAYGRQAELRSPKLVPVSGDQLEDLVKDTLNKLKEGNTLPTSPPFIATVGGTPTKLDGARFGKPWMGAVMSNDPEENERTNEIIRELIIHRPKSEIIERGDDEIKLMDIATQYFNKATSSYGAFLSMISIAYRQPESIKVTGQGIELTDGVNDFARCILNYILRNHKALGADVNYFFDQAYRSYTFTKMAYGYEIYIDQVEPNVFRIHPKGDNYETTFTWKQTSEGHILKRNHK